MLPMLGGWSRNNKSPPRYAPPQSPRRSRRLWAARPSARSPFRSCPETPRGPFIRAMAPLSAATQVETGSPHPHAWPRHERHEASPPSRPPPNPAVLRQPPGAFVRSFPIEHKLGRFESESEGEPSPPADAKQRARPAEVTVVHHVAAGPDPAEAASPQPHGQPPPRHPSVWRSRDSGHGSEIGSNNVQAPARITPASTAAVDRFFKGSSLPRLRRWTLQVWR
jgi:hypothetical protein